MQRLREPTREIKYTSIDEMPIINNNIVITYQKFLCEYFKFQIDLKMFHFQTSKFNHHKIVDEYSKKLADNFDKLFEVFQGKYGRIKINDKNINIGNILGNNFVIYIDKFINQLLSIHSASQNESFLISIIDDMLQDIYQCKYLLSFE
ncbi:hypothetical protein Hokovirus_4_33 [Hokovirus HKV1]|uniref:Uncharacterized protein n=1 Tax=Hokovirus HKV1 TaxID=1977638 RepID=A0A1V0SH56_9VIRU|nr:hypothetical protein Hokovirus_4_33 [Hokovirus HKV1]